FIPSLQFQVAGSKSQVIGHKPWVTCDVRLETGNLRLETCDCQYIAVSPAGVAERARKRTRGAPDLEKAEHAVCRALRADSKLAIGSGSLSPFPRWFLIRTLVPPSS